MDYKNFSEILSCISSCENNISFICSKIDCGCFTSLQEELLKMLLDDLFHKICNCYDSVCEECEYDEKNEIVKEKK